MRIEAEAMSLSNYQTETYGGASGGKVAKLVSKDIGVATASTVFDGPAGTYDLSLGFIDEFDGQGAVRLMVGDTEMGSWTLDEDDNSKTTVTVEGVVLTAGDKISIVGESEDGERARVDFLEINGVSDGGHGDTGDGGHGDTGDGGHGDTGDGGHGDTGDGGHGDTGDGGHGDTGDGGHGDTGDGGHGDTGDGDGGHGDTGDGDGGHADGSDVISMRIEAEAMSLSNYETESFSGASGGKVAKLVSKDIGVATASTVFDGPVGTYDLSLGFIDESDGQGAVRLMVGDIEVGSWTLDDDDNSDTIVTVEGILLTPGDEIFIIGESEAGERARVDFIEINGVAASAEQGDTGDNGHGDDGHGDTGDGEHGDTGDGGHGDTGDSGHGDDAEVISMRIEAEAMSLSNYQTEFYGGASGGKVAKLVSKDIGVATASTVFDGPAGTYDLSLGFIDEFDGQGTVRLMVGDTEIGSWTLDEDDNSKTTVTVEGVVLTAGDKISIVGESEDGERARVDFLEINGVSDGGHGDDPGSEPQPDPAPTPDKEPEPDPDPVEKPGPDPEPVEKPDPDPEPVETLTISMFSEFAEWTLRDTMIDGNPYDMDASVTFTHVETGETIKSGVFYDGDGVYKFRFTGTKPGEWVFESESAHVELDGFTGAVNVESNPDARGFVVAENGKFAQQIGDGSLEALLPNYVMIDADLSNYADDPGKIHELVNTFIKEHGFTGFHIPNIGGQFFNLDNSEGDAGSAIGSLPEYNPDPRTFEVLEEIIKVTHQAGGVVHIWPWGDSQRGQTPDELPGGELGDEHLRLLEYMADRLGPLPGWTMGYGFDNNEWTNPDLVAERTAFFDAQTDYDHLLGVRSTGPNSGTNHDADVQWHDDQGFADFEHHEPTYEVYSAAVDAAGGSPVQSGDRFRVREEDGPGKDYTEAQTVDGLWNSTMAGGVSNIWGNLTDFETGEVNYAGNSGSYAYSEDTIDQISTWNTFMLGNDWFALDAVRANDLTGGTEENQYGLYSEDDKSLIVYAEDTQSITLNLSKLADEFEWSDSAEIIAVDTEQAYSEISLGTVDLVDQSIELDANSDWALYISDDTPFL